MNNQRYQAIQRANLLSALVNLVQAIFKVLVGWIGHSPALFTDGIHSFSDLLSNLLVWLASKFGAIKPDHNHPYGHRRFETFGSLTLGLLLLVVAGGFIYEAVMRIIAHALIVPHLSTLVVAIVSVILNESVFRYSLAVATRVQSSLLRANAYHNRADSLSSFIVIIGILGALAGVHYADAIATVLIAAFIIKIAVELIWNAVNELTDAGLPEQEVKALETLITGLSGVKAMHQLRTRKMGDKIFVDVHVLIAPYVSASEGHYIAETVHYHLKKQFPAIEDVIIHVDTEDHPETVPERLLPSRKEIEAVLFPRLKDSFSEQEIVLDLFYYRDKLEVRMTLPLSSLQVKTPSQWQGEIKDILKHFKDIQALRVRFKEE